MKSERKCGSDTEAPWHRSHKRIRRDMKPIFARHNPVVFHAPTAVLRIRCLDDSDFDYISTLQFEDYVGSSQKTVHEMLGFSGLSQKVGSNHATEVYNKKSGKTGVILGLKRDIRADFVAYCFEFFR